MSEEKIGDRLDGLGVTLDLDDGDLIASCLVLCKVITADGAVTLGMANDESCTWLEQLGLLAGAQQVINSQAFTSGDE